MIINALNLVKIDNALDYIPVVSTVTNIVKLALRTLQNIFHRSGENRNHYFTHIHNQSIPRSIALIIPGIGNFVVAIIDLIRHTQAVRHFNHAEEYHQGRGTEQNNVKALAELKKAADKGHLLAQAKLGTVYLNTNDAKEAVHLYRISAAEGNKKALHGLAFCHLNGLGVDPDPVRAVELYQDASDEGYSRSTQALAELYYAGIGVTQPDPTKAQQLFVLAEKQSKKETKQETVFTPQPAMDRMRFYPLEPSPITSHYHGHHHHHGHHHRGSPRRYEEGFISI